MTIIQKGEAMRLIDADRLLEDKRIEKYYHLKNGDIAIPLIDIKHAPTVEERTETHSCDLISRQAAIDALNEYFARIGKLKRRGLSKGEKAISLDTVGVIKTMPSAQPEPDEWCTDCKEYDHDKHCCPRFNKVIRGTVEEVKGAQPKTGKWQITDAYPHNVYCSECHTRFAQTHWAVWEDGTLPRNFCPNCGARMEG